MYICATYQIFEKLIFAKVGFTLLILNKVRAQRGANDFGRREKSLVTDSSHLVSMLPVLGFHK